MNSQEYDLLLQGYLDDTLSPEQRQELAAALEADGELRREFGQDIADATLLSAHLGDQNHDASVRSIMMLIKKSRPSQRQAAISSIRKATTHARTLRWTRAWQVAATAAAVLAIVVLYRGPAEKFDEQTLIASIGSGACHVRRGMESLRATAGMPLMPGDRISADADAKCSFAYADGSHVDLNAASVCVVGNGKRLELVGGEIYVTAAKQPASAPLTIHTRDADAVITGTKFEVALAVGGTDLRVAEGSVRFNSAAGSVLVAGGQASHCRAGTAPTPPAGIDSGAIASWLRGALPFAVLEAEDMGEYSSKGGGGGLAGEYFDNVDFSGKSSRDISHVDFDWRGAAPAPGIGSDSFSVRWTGFIRCEKSQEYEFTVTATDGVRLWIDGVQLINHWQAGEKAELSGKIALTAGTMHDVKLENFQNGDQGVLTLSWSTASSIRSVVPANNLFPFAGAQLWGRGDCVEKEVAFAVDGSCRFDIDARGYLAEGVWSIMELLIDQRPVASIPTDSSDWKTYSITAHVGAGKHAVAVAFVNDLETAPGGPSPQEQRDLDIDKITIYREKAQP